MRFLPRQAVGMKRAKLGDVRGGWKQWGRIVVSGCHEGGKGGGSEGGGSHEGGRVVGVVDPGVPGWREVWSGGLGGEGRGGAGGGLGQREHRSFLRGVSAT